MSEPRFAGRLALQQRVLPDYRAAFFETLAARCDGGLNVFAGQPRSSEAIRSAHRLTAATWEPARNLHLFAGPLYTCLQPGIMDWLERLDPQALILEANPRYLSSQGAIDWMQRRGRPVVGWGLGAPGWSPLRGRMLRGLDAVIAYSSRGAQGYRSLGIPANRVFVAPNAVTGPPAQLHRSQRPPDHPLRVLFVGRLQQRKRVDLLLEACRHIPDPPELVIVGEGPHRKALERAASRIYPAARFLGELRGPELEQVFGEAELFVLPGTGGLAVQQAMAHGLPVIVAEADGSQSDLVRPENGWMVESGSLDSLTDALRQAAADPARLREMGRESHRIVTEQVNIEVMADVFIQALERAAQP